MITKVREFTYEGKEYKSLNFKNGSCLVALKTAFENADELKKKIEAKLIHCISFNVIEVIQPSDNNDEHQG